jgi:hypothetical protein
MSDEKKKEDTTTTVAYEDKEEDENVDNYYTNFFRKISKLILDEVNNADKVTPELDNKIAEKLRPKQTRYIIGRNDDFEKDHFCHLSKKLLVNPCKVTVTGALKTAEDKIKELEREILNCTNSSSNEKGDVDIESSKVARTDIKVLKEANEKALLKGEIQQQKEKKMAEPSNSTNEDITCKIAELQKKIQMYQKIIKSYLKLEGKIFDKKSVEEYLKRISQDLKEDNEQKRGDTDVDKTWWQLDEDDKQTKNIKDKIKSIENSVGFLQYEFLKHMYELQSISLDKDDIDSAMWSDTISDIEKMYITNFDRQEFFKENNRKEESSTGILLPLQLATKYGLYNVTLELLRPAFWEGMINVPDMEGKTCLFYLVENMFESQKANMKMLGPPSEGIRSLEMEGKDNMKKYKKEHELQGILSSVLTDFEKRSKKLLGRKKLVKVFSSKSCSEAKNHPGSPQKGYSLFYNLERRTEESKTTENIPIMLNTKYGGPDGNLEWCRLLALLMVHGAYLDAKDVKGKCIFHLEYCKLSKNRMTLLEHINRVYLWGLPKPESSSSDEDVNWIMKLNDNKCWHWDYEQKEIERFTKFFEKMKIDKSLEKHWNQIKNNVVTEKGGTDSDESVQNENNEIKCSSGKHCKSKVFRRVAKFLCPYCGDCLNPEYHVSYCNNKKCSTKIEGKDIICEQCMFDIGERWKRGHECLVKHCKGRIKGFWLNCTDSQTQSPTEEEDVIKSVSPDITAARYLREVCQTVLDAGGEYELCSTNKSGCNFLTILSYCDQATLFGVINNFDARYIFTKILLAAVSHPKVAQGFNITKLMIKQKADLNGIKMDSTGLKRSAIVLAARSRNFALCKQLISNGAKISVDDFHSIISYLNLANVAKKIEKTNAKTRDRVNSEVWSNKRRRSSIQLVKPQTERIDQDTLREFCRLILFFGAANGSLSMNLIDSMKKSMKGTKIENWMIDEDDNGLTCLHYGEFYM